MTTTREKICAGNWKMYKTPDEARAFFKEWKAHAQGLKCKILIFPPAYNLPAVQESVVGLKVEYGPQNIYYTNEGAFTGEISPRVVKVMGATYVLIGHSERRTHFYEDDVLIAKKVKAALEEGLMPLLCVGETLVERQNGRTNSAILTQLKNGLAQVSKEARFVVAYEPVWAIGTGEVATPEQVVEVHEYIRRSLKDLLGEEGAQAIPILYGGSVKPDNAAGLAAMPNIDGFLVGGASLNPADFFEIAKTLS